LLGGKKTPEEKERIMDSLKIARSKIFNRIYENLPEHLRSKEPNQLMRAMAEQINYATASSQFEGDDEEMLEKLKALVAELRRNGADKAANEIVSAVAMRPHYLDAAERIMR
jgi:hypothetical protein